MNKGEGRLKRVRWKSRRGMKELDVLFERFLLQQQTTLIAGAWPQFEELLEAEDTTLFDWISGRNLPADESLLTLIDAIKSGT